MLTICSLGFFKSNVDELLSLEAKQVVYCILCHTIALGVHVLGSKTCRKALISYKSKNEILAMKRIVKLNILTFKKCMLVKLYDHILLIYKCL
jgi:hypothetical protein